MAIKIRKKVEKVEQEKKVLEPDEVLLANGTDASSASPSAGNSRDGAPDLDSVKVPEMSDKFLRTSGSIFQWVLEHRRMVILCVAVVVLVAFGFVGVHYYGESVATERSSKLTDVFGAYQALTKEEAEALTRESEAYLAQQGIASNAEDVLRPKNVVPNNQIRFKAIKDHLQKTLPELAQDDVGKSGKLMLAGVTARLNDDAAAAAVYDETANSLNSDVALFGQIGKAEALVGQQKYDEALAILEQVMAKNPKFSSYITMEKGRLFENMGQIDKAIQAYDAVLNQFNQPDDQAKAMARLRILTPDAASHLKPVEVQNIPQQQVAQ